MADEATKTALPPYISYKTFENLLTHLEGGVPPRLDRSVWGRHYSGSTGLQLLTGLRFLGLIEGQANLVTPRLEQLVDEKDSRKQLLAEILHERYAPIFQAVGDLSKATPAMLEEAFRKQYGIRDETLRKVISFFVHAAQAAGISISKRITDRTRVRSTPSKSPSRTNGKKSQQASSAASHHETVKEPPRKSPVTFHLGSSANEETVTLPHGGTATLNLSVNWIKMGERERQALLEVIDAFRALPEATSQDDDYSDDYSDEDETDEEEE